MKVHWFIGLPYSAKSLAASAFACVNDGVVLRDVFTGVQQIMTQGYVNPPCRLRLAHALSQDELIGGMSPKSLWDLDELMCIAARGKPALAVTATVSRQWTLGCLTAHAIKRGWGFTYVLRDYSFQWGDASASVLTRGDVPPARVAGQAWAEWANFVCDNYSNSMLLDSSIVSNAAELHRVLGIHAHDLTDTRILWRSPKRTPDAMASDMSSMVCVQDSFNRLVNTWGDHEQH